MTKELETVTTGQLTRAMQTVSRAITQGSVRELVEKGIFKAERNPLKPTSGWNKILIESIKPGLKKIEWDAGKIIRVMRALPKRK